MGEHRPYKPGVTGSSPVPPTIRAETVDSLDKFRGRSSDWLERRPVTPEVASSILVAPAILDKGFRIFPKPFFDGVAKSPISCVVAGYMGDINRPYSSN